MLDEVPSQYVPSFPTYALPPSERTTWFDIKFLVEQIRASCWEDGRLGWCSFGELTRAMHSGGD